MKVFEKSTVDMDNIAVEPGDLVLITSRSCGETSSRIGEYLGLDLHDDPVVRYSRTRWYWNSATDCGYKPHVVITSLPRKRMWNCKHLMDILAKSMT